MAGAVPISEDCSIGQHCPGYATYELALSNFSATLGGFAFPLEDNPALAPVIEIFRGFAFFGGNFSEPSIGYSSYLPGAPTITGTIQPFAGNAGRSQQLAMGGVFQDDDVDAPLTIDSLLGRGPAFYQSFQYSTRDPLLRQSGVLNGSYTGAFAAAVPEPSTWALMLIGIAAVGASLRRRSRSDFGRQFAS